MPRIVALVLLGLSLHLLTPIAAAQAWYVRGDNWSGLPGNGSTLSTPWKGFRSIVWGPGGVQPGDTVYLANGDIYYDTLYVQASGQPGNQITIACPDGGSCVIDGKLVRYSGIDSMDKSHIVVRNVTARNHTVSGIRFLGVGTDLHVIKSTTYRNANYGILYRVDSGTMRDIVIRDNIAFENGRNKFGSGIYLTADAMGKIYSVVIEGNRTYRNNGRYGIGVYPKNGGSVHFVEVMRNISYENGSTGIDFSNNVFDSSIYKNNCSRNGTSMPGAGIHLGGVAQEYSQGVDVYDNETSFQLLQDTDGPGILIDEFVTDARVYRNNTHHNQEAGIKLHGSSRIYVFANLITDNPFGIFTPSAIVSKIYNNTITKSSRAGIFIAETAQHTTVLNNIVKQSAVGIRVDNTAASIFVSRNCLNSNAEEIIDKRRLVVLSYESISTDPKFANEPVGDFRLLATSPCRNRGVDVGPFLGFDLVSTVPGQRPHVGAFQGDALSP